MENVILVNDVQAAEVLGIAPATLRKWRCLGGGPGYYRIGRLIRYRSDELFEWVEGHRKQNTSQYEK